MYCGSPGGDAAPWTLADLRLWLVGSDRLAASLTPLCGVEVLRADGWRSAIESHSRPAFLLVETHAGIDAEWGDELDPLLGVCVGEGIPRLLWVGDAQARPSWRGRYELFDAVFAVDRGLLDELQALGAPDPSPLWPAAALPPRRARPGAAPEGGVLWPGGWRPDWPAEWRDRLAAALRAAGRHGLRIAAAEDLDGMPDDLRGHVVRGAAHAGPGLGLREARLILGADPASGSATLAPPVVFDAIAAGVAVVTPHEFFTIHDFGVGEVRGSRQKDLIPVVRGREDAAEEIDLLLGDDRLRAETVDHLQRIVANNHMPEHRLATLASAAGHHLVPDARDPAPA